MRTFFLVALLFFSHSPILLSQPQINLNLYADGLTRPVDIAHAGDSRMFVVEQAGVIKIIDSAFSIRSTPFLDIKNRVRTNDSEQGLLGLAFHPNFAQNGYFYVNYTIQNWDTRVSRFSIDSLNPEIADPNSEVILLTYGQPFINHNGGDLAFGDDGYLYISSGDGGSGGDPGDRAQSGQTLLGKILRIDIDSDSLYAIPSNNPFVDSTNILDEIWSTGWRNPWRFSFDRLTGDMWIADVGQDEYEEISFEEKGNTGGDNYGWRCYEGFEKFNTTKCDTATQLIDPVFAYEHSDTTGRSITGGFVYRGQAYTDLIGHYVMGDFRSGYFWTIYRDSTGAFSTKKQGKLMGTNQCSTFGEDKDGELFVAGVREGKIYQVEAMSTRIGLPIDHQIKAYPNPWVENLTIEFPNPGNQEFSFSLTDSQGRLINSKANIRGEIIELERGDLSPGIYFIQLKGPYQLTGKILIAD